MIGGIGVDLVHIPRLQKWLANRGLMERFFTRAEIETALSKGGGAESLAARFAAKEAFGKALGVGLRGFELKEAEVGYADSGAPELRLQGAAAALFVQSGATRLHLSLSHEKDYAAAFVVLEKE